MADNAALPLAGSVPTRSTPADADLAAVFETKAARIDHGGNPPFALWLKRAIGGAGPPHGRQHEK
jgi:hypothetical protein